MNAISIYVVHVRIIIKLRQSPVAPFDNMV